MATSDKLFTEAPEEVTRYFDAKGQRPSFDWQDVAPYEHAVTFTVAKTTGFDVLDDIRAAVDSVIRNYDDYGTFLDRLEPTLRAKGWWGTKALVDPVTGETVRARLGSLHRLRTIYWANVSSARAAGEWERTQRTKRALPYLVYQLSTAEHKRLEHQSWVGTILPVDDPWWATHYPPNGWLCRCRVAQISAREARQLGYDPSKGAPPIEWRTFTNTRTGERVQVPKGIDPGWQGNPGMRRADTVQSMLRGRLVAMTDDQRRVAVDDLVRSRLMRAIQGQEFAYAGPIDQGSRATGRIATPIAVVSDAVQAATGRPARLVEFSVADAWHQGTEKGRERQYLTPADYARVQVLLDRGRLAKSTSPRGPGTRTFGVSGEIDGQSWWAAIVYTVDGDRAFLRHLYRRRSAELPSKTWEWLD